ncbi:MAG: ParB/RepB/Spo0J family partition protein [Rickettsiales bacterium]
MKIDQAKIRYPEKKKEMSQIKTTRASIFTENYREEILNIPIQKLFPYSKQARQSFDEESLQNLAQTIKSHGIRQPLTVVDIEGNGEKYEVVSGERRLRAAKLAGLDRVPCRVLKSPKDAVEIAIIENLQREDLHPIEVARSLQSLLDEGICRDQKEISEKVGMPKSTVSELLSFLKISPKFYKDIINNKIQARESLRSIRDASSDEERMKLLQSNTPSPPPLKKVESANKSSTSVVKTRKVLSVTLENGNLKFDVKVSKLTEDQKKQILNRIEKVLFR